jgi:hypothetical protein
MLRAILLMLLIAGSCRKKPVEERPNILTLKEMSDLATVEYTVTKIIKANDNKTWFKVGDRKILMSCEAYIKAGIDISSITENNFKIEGKSVHLQLPPPKIISLSIPPDKIKVEYQDISMLRDPYGTAERDELALQAETQIRNSVDSLGILQQAKANTSLFVSNFLKRLGYDNVTITYASSQPSIFTQ